MTVELYKAQAKRLHAFLSKTNSAIAPTYSYALEAVAVMNGHRNWNTFSALLEQSALESASAPAPAERIYNFVESEIETYPAASAPVKRIHRFVESKGQPAAPMTAAEKRDVLLVPGRILVLQGGTDTAQVSSLLASHLEEGWPATIIDFSGTYGPYSRWKKATQCDITNPAKGIPAGAGSAQLVRVTCYADKVEFFNDQIKGLLPVIEARMEDPNHALVIDGFFQSMNPMSQHQLLQLVKKWRAKGKRIVMTSSGPELNNKLEARGIHSKEVAVIRTVRAKVTQIKPAEA